MAKVWEVSIRLLPPCLKRRLLLTLLRYLVAEKAFDMKMVLGLVHLRGDTQAMDV